MFDPPTQPKPRHSTEELFHAEPTDWQARVQWWEKATIATWQLIDRGLTFDARHITDMVGREYPGDARHIARFIFESSKKGYIQLWGYAPSRSHTSNAVVAQWQPTGLGMSTAETVLPPEQRWDAVAHLHDLEPIF